MGIISSYYDWLWKKYRMKILIFGIDSAGKTTILYRLKLKETIEPHITRAASSSLRSTLGHRYSTATAGRHYIPGTNAVIFVIDSSDDSRLLEARGLLDELLKVNELLHVPLLVMANKQDLPGAMTASELSERLGLDAVGQNGQRLWHTVATCAKTGVGLHEGLDWLALAVTEAENARKLKTNT
ncbi:hypothetical protein HK101_011073 [Irineochytrium annulatum]|nr:hypothetical protein HK101_011073 [Irineochytrium annulatum]